MAVNIFDPAFDIPHPVNVFPPAFDLTGVLPPAVIERYFTELASAGSQYYTIPEITLAGDFEIELDFYITSLSSFNMLLTSTSNSGEYIGINPAGDIIYASDGAFNNMGSVVVNQYYTLTLSRSSGAVSGNLSGTSLAGFSNATTLQYGNIGRRGVGTVLYFNGIISNVRIKDNGTLVRSYDIDEDWVDSNVLVNDAAVLGGELVVNGDFSDGVNGWASASTLTSNLLEINGELQVTTTANFGRAIQSISTVIGETYIVSVDVYPQDGDTAVVQISNLSTGGGAGAPVPAQTTAIDKTLGFAFTATNTTTYIAVGSALAGIGNVNVFDNISIRQADGYGTAVNITDADAFHVTQDAGDWLGDELVVNGGFDNGTTGWVVSNVSSVNGVATFSASGFMYQDCAPPDQIVRVSFDGNLVSSPQLKIGDNSNPLGRIQFNGNIGSTVDNVSVKRLLETAP